MQPEEAGHFLDQGEMRRNPWQYRLSESFAAFDFHGDIKQASLG